MTWSRVRQAAEVFAALPDGVAASLHGKMQAPALKLLSGALVAGAEDARQLRRVLRAFILELSERSGAALPDLGRRTLVQLCRFHPEQAAGVLDSWLLTEQPEAASLNEPDHSLEPWEKELPFNWTRAPLSGPSIAAILVDLLAPEWKEDIAAGLDAAKAEHFWAATRLLLPAATSLQEQLLKDFAVQFGEQVVQPEVTLRCLKRVAGETPMQPPPARAKDWQGLLIYHGDLLENFLGDEASLAEIGLHRSQLQHAWNRSFPDYLLVARTELGPFEVVVRLGEELLDQFELVPDRILQEQVWLEEAELEPFARSETYLQVLARKLWSVQARLARTFAVRGSSEGQLPSELVPAMAALRAFPADYLSQHLMELEPEGLWRVAESLPGLFALSPDLLNERLLDSCQLSPLELMQQAGLWPVDSSRCPVRVSAVAILLTIAPEAGSIARELVQKLGRTLGQQLTERMMRIFYRWQDRRLETSETYPHLAAFLSWRNRGASCRRDAPAVELADAISRVWPLWSEAEAHRLFVEQVCVQDLYRYIQEESGLETYVPGPVLAAQFLHSLNDTEALRLELYWLDYPVPHLTLDLALLERAQNEWNRASL